VVYSESNSDYAKDDAANYGLGTGHYHHVKEQTIRVDPGKGSHTVTGLTNGIAYSFQFITFDTAGNNAFVINEGDRIDMGIDVYGRPEAVDTTPPLNGQIELLYAGDGEATVSMNLSATLNHRFGLDFDHFELSVCLGPHTNPDGWLREMEVVRTITVPESAVTASTISYSARYTVTGLTNGLPYYFTVKTVDAAGNKSKGSTDISRAAIPTAEPQVHSAFNNTQSADGTVATIGASSTLPGTFYYVVYDRNAPEPSVETIVAQGAALAKGTGTVNSYEERFPGVIAVPGPGVYAGYVVVKNAAGYSPVVLVLLYTSIK
jgi:hypothetical protein